MAWGVHLWSKMLIFKGKPENGSVYHATISESMSHALQIVFGCLQICSQCVRRCHVTWTVAVKAAAVMNYAWPPNSNLANLVIYGVFIKTSTFCHINRHPNQYILADTIFNYRFHFGLPGKCLYLSPQNTPFWRRQVYFPDFSKDMFLEVQNETCS